MSAHVLHMQHAYDLALKGWGRVSPNPMVGAVIVKGAAVIAQGWHAHLGGAHAEAMALTKAGTKAKGADLYVTLEPCSYFGRTPPCATAIVAAGIRRVFVGVRDPNPRMNGKSIKLLRHAGIEVQTGFLQAELTVLNETFNKYITTGLPFVTAKIAQTLDGKTAMLSGKSKWITSPDARSYAREMRFGFDAILVGINTVLKDNPALSPVPEKSFKKIILDTKLKIPKNAKLFNDTNPEDVLIFTASEGTAGLKAMVIKTPQKKGRLDLKWILQYLGKHEIGTVLIEGGSKVIGSALAGGLIDKLMVYVAPKIMGDGVPSVRGLGLQSLPQAIQLRNISVGSIGGDILIEAYV